MESTEKKSELKEMAERFRVCWEVWPEYRYVNDEKRQIGFSLELYGTHEPRVEHPSPGCPECFPVFEALKSIAREILPREERPSTYEIGIYDAELHYTSKRANRPDVMVPIKILHREGFELPLDECEVRCLNEMKQRLRDIGAYEGRWRPRNEER